MYEECGIGICLLFCEAREEVAGVSSRHGSKAPVPTEPSSHSGSLVYTEDFFLDQIINKNLWKIIRVSEKLYGKLLTEFDQLELFS